MLYFLVEEKQRKFDGYYIIFLLILLLPVYIYCYIYIGYTCVCVMDGPAQANIKKRPSYIFAPPLYLIIFMYSC
jgi:hypothetical protein